MGLRHRLLGFVFAAVVAHATHAAPIGFANDTGNSLYSIDFGTGTATLIGSLGIAGALMESLALAPNGTLYGASSAGNLYTIDTSTGAATLIGSTGLGNIEGLDFNGNTLLATNFNGTPSVYSLNLATAAPTLVATANTATGLVRSMTVLNATTILIRGDLNDDTLFSMDLGTGVVSMIGAQPDTVYGMDFLSDGNLYGVGDPGLLFLINPATAALTGIGDTGDHFWLSLTGAATVTQVPVPGTLLLLGLGLTCLALQRRKH